MNALQEPLPRPSRPTLLYVSSTVPRLMGSGVAMRAGVQLRALTSLFNVTLAIVTPDEGDLEYLPQVLSRACSSVIVVALPSLYTRVFRGLQGAQARRLLEAAWPLPEPMAKSNAGVSELAWILTGRHFDVIQCFRMRTASLTRRLKTRGVTGSKVVIDMDDYESFARFRYVRRLRAEIGLQFAILRWLEGLKFAIAEKLLLPRFREAYVCSDTDQAVLTARFPKVKWIVIPNVVAEPEINPREDIDRVFTFLFVGTLDYAPNAEGILYFCKDVLPLLRQSCAQAFRVLIVGRNPDVKVRQLADLPNVEIIANPPSIAPFYWNADVCIAPIRAGGGTRIKILEAFSYGLPVVSTTIGAEGLGLIPGSHAEIADSAPAFADACRRLVANSDDRTRLAAAGIELYRTRFSVNVLSRLFSQIHADVLNHPAAGEDIGSTPLLPRAYLSP